MSNSKQRELIRYTYDPLDQLTGNTQSGSPLRHHYYCKNRLTTQIQGAIGHSIVQHGDFLLAQQQRQQDERVTTLLSTDLQRSVLHTLKKTTERHAIAYSPYGHRPALNGLLSLLGFNGERPDPVTGHYLLGNGYRAFNPNLMRFNSPDSLSPFGKGGLNGYAYCLGDPINRGDPSGHTMKNFFRATFTRTIQVADVGTLQLLPKTSIMQAMRAENEILKINRKIAKYGVNHSFKINKKNLFDPKPLQPENLKNFNLTQDQAQALARIQARGQAQRSETLKQFYDELSTPRGDLNDSALTYMASNGSVVNQYRDNRTLMELATSYENAISFIRQGDATLKAERATIISSNFRLK